MNKKLIFEPKEHKYFYEDKELISASTLVSLYSPIFDESGTITQNCALKKGITADELRKEWDDECEKACDTGKRLHSQAEYWIKNKKIDENGDYADVIKQLSEINFKGKLASERQVCAPALGIAGTIDISVFSYNNVVSLYDLKSNKKMTKRGFFKKGHGYEKMLYPINHLESSLINKYSIQLSIYAIMEEENGFWIDELELLYVNPKSRLIERYPVKYMRQEVLDILDHYHGRKVKEKIVEVDDFGF